MPVAQHDLRQVRKTAARAGAIQQVVVLAADGVGAIRITAEPRSLTHKGGVNQFERIQWPAGDLAMCGGVGALAYRHTRIVKQHSPSAGEVYFGMFQQKAYLLFEAQWIRDIVGVHARHVNSSGTLDTLVEACSQFETPPVTPD